MRVPAYAAVAVITLLGLMSPAQADRAMAADFKSLLDVHWAFARAERVYFRNDPDAWRMEGQLSSHTETARNRRRDFNEEILAQLEDIDPSELSKPDRISYEVFRYERETERRSYQQPLHYFPFTSLFGYHTYFAEAPANMSFLTAADYDQYLVSLGDFPRYNGEIINNLKQAAESGFAHYCESLNGYDETISVHVVSNPEASKLYYPFDHFPPAISEAQRTSYHERGTALIRDKVVPGYQRLLDFYRNQYLPSCRNQVGIHSVPGGESLYRFLIEYFTTTDMSPKAIHDSRQKALDFMLENTALSELEANNEIDRYITWPAQALSYKIGELKIRELRAYAEQELGPAFDLRAFHDSVVGNGSLPIEVLEKLVRDWVVSAAKVSAR